MPLAREIYRYLDSGTLYLTEEQQRAFYLRIRIRIISYRPSVSYSFTRNPPQSVWGWSTGMHNSCVVFEKAQRFDFEQVYRDSLDATSLAVLMCLYHQAATENLVAVGFAIPTTLPFAIGELVALSPSTDRELDSVRYVGLVPQVFEFDVTWLRVGDTLGECTPAIFPEPPPPPPEEGAPPQDENESPAPLPPPRQEELPDDQERTFPPLNRLPGDFGSRNTDDPNPPDPIDLNCPSGARILFNGTAAAGNVGQSPLPNTTHEQIFPGAVDYILTSTALATNADGVISRYFLNGANVSGGSWYSISIVSITCV